MSKRLLIICCLLFAVPSVVAVLAQNQSIGAPDFQTAPSGVDNQGVRHYRLGPGDLLDVRVFGQPDLNSQVDIDEDGNISSLPFIEDPIPARCRNEKEVQKLITDAYAKYIVKPRVSVRILERRSRPPAIVFGAVRLPSRVTMNRRLRLLEVLTTAGGVTQNASGSIDVLHTEAEMCVDPEDDSTPGAAVASAVAANHTKESDIGKIETYKLVDLKGGSAGSNPFIRPGDIVIVTEGEPVFVTGAVFAPHELVIKDGLTLARAIAMCGGAQKLAKTSEVHVYRKKEGKIGSEDLKFNYDAIKKGREQDVVLQAYDIIDVRSVGALAPKSIAEILRNVGTGSLGVLPMRLPIP